MKQYTEEERAALIKFLRGGEVSHQEHLRFNEMAREIALEALTESPFSFPSPVCGYIVEYGGTDKELFLTLRDAERFRKDVDENGFLEVKLSALTKIEGKVE